ncbi:MAG: CotH kinase family protein [Chitinophagaceae bacterium]
MRFLIAFAFIMPLNLKAQITTNLPIVKISTTGTINDIQQQANIAIIDNVSGVNNENDPATFSSMIGVKIKGSSTVVKPSYSVETWSAPNVNLNVSLMGMPPENDWILLSSYNDRSFLRTMLAFELHRKMGRYAPRFKPCEVFLNNAYQGIYLFGEKIKQDTGRVDMANLRPIDNSGDQITGGYIFKIDDGTPDWQSQYNPPYAASTQKIDFQYDTPDASVITPAQKNYIKTYVDSFEIVLNGSNFQDTTSGWRRFGAENSFLDFMLIQEISKNYDAYRTNTFLYKDKLKKMRPGPLWGFDKAWYNTSDCSVSTDTGYVYNIGASCSSLGQLAPFWWKKLTTDTAFYRLLKCTYNYERNPGKSLDTTSIFNFIDSVSTVLNANGAINRNFAQWPIWAVPLNNEPTPMPVNYTEEINTMKQFIKRRLNWLDAQWVGTGCSYPVATQNELAASDFRIFPNPVYSHLTLSSASNLVFQYTLMDLSGRVLLKKDKVYHTEILNLSTYSKGLYIIQIEQNGKQLVQKIVVE